jgi:hypothetical protein
MIAAGDDRLAGNFLSAAGPPPHWRSGSGQVSTQKCHKNNVWMILAYYLCLY